ncbi:MAG: hypothetical protein NWS74_01130 [Salibacteraceae bacterium]|nr:hypothetical protein [Salibacteraceae bacterium]
MKLNLTYRIAGLLFAALLLLQSQGPWLIFKVQQFALRSEIKHQIKAGIPHHDLVRIAIANAWETEKNDRIEWEHSKEFRFDGEWYDVVKSEAKLDSTVYFCIHDAKESHLFARLDAMTLNALCEPDTEEKRTTYTFVLISKYPAGKAASNLYLNEMPMQLASYFFSKVAHCSKVPTPPPNTLV